jgi:hypothetical protein
VEVLVTTKYVATTGLNYLSATSGKPIRVEAGDEVVEMGKKTVEQEMLAGNIVPADVETGEETEVVVVSPGTVVVEAPVENSQSLKKKGK